MAQGDLFDISSGGHGFHISSHLIGVVALFIAIFALAGFIRYRSDSIPDRALKNKDHQGETVRVPITASGAAGKTEVFEITQPTNTYLNDVFQTVTDAFTVAATTNLTVQIGTARTTADVVAQNFYQAGTTHALGSAPTGGEANNAANNDISNLTNSLTRTSTTVERKLYIQIGHAANVIASAANAGEILFMFDFMNSQHQLLSLSK